MKSIRRQWAVLSLGLAVVCATAASEPHYSPWSDGEGEGDDFSAAGRLPNCECNCECCSWELNAPDFKQCLDQLVFERIFSDKGQNAERNSIAGAVVAVVHDGVATTQGYGCADASSGRKVSQDTLFRVGSISKAITASAVMQLVEDGIVELGADIRKYLDFALPRPYRLTEKEAGEIALQNLLTHTAGFEENLVGMVQHPGHSLVGLKDFLKKHQPARIRPAAENLTEGFAAGYSNWGMALAGYIVQREAGKAQKKDILFQDYVDSEIFQPLKMKHSTFWEPGQVGWKGNWDAELAFGHSFSNLRPTTAAVKFDPDQGIPCPPHPNGRFKPQEFEHLTALAPASSLSVSGADMARFMLAHLNQGALDGKEILSPDSIRQMHRIGSEHPRLLVPVHFPDDFDASGLVFYQISRDGLRILLHNGATLDFRAFLALIPETKTGLFVAVNSPGENSLLLRNFFQDFLRRFITKNGLVPTDRAHSADAARYSGAYSLQRHSFSTNEKFFQYVNPSYIRVDYVPESDTLQISNLQGALSRWQAVGTGLFRWVLVKGEKVVTRYQQLIAFDEGGNRTRILGIDTFTPAYRLASHETPEFHQRLLSICQMAFLAALCWPLVSYAATGAAHGPTLARRLAILLAGANLVALTLLLRAFTDGRELHYGYPGVVYFALSLLLASLVLTVGVVAGAALAWRHYWWSTGERMYYTLFALLAVAFLWSMNHWNLIGFKLS